MRTLIVFLIGLAIGAAGFHVWYLGMSPGGRCTWDHPLDHTARARCEDAATFKGYATKAREQLDDLVGKVDR